MIDRLCFGLIMLTSLAGCTSTTRINLSDEPSPSTAVNAIPHLNRALRHKRVTLTLHQEQGASLDTVFVGYQIRVTRDSTHWMDAQTNEAYAVRSCAVHTMEYKRNNARLGLVIGALGGMSVGLLVATKTRCGLISCVYGGLLKGFLGGSATFGLSALIGAGTKRTKRYVVSEGGCPGRSVP